MTDNQQLRDWYRKVPYLSLPFRCTHPDSLFIQASLAGLTPVPVSHCRVLEIGCASGGNLLPMCQTLPQARFVGVDLSPGQIAIATDVASRANLTNVEFICSDLAEFHAAGSFDFIIAHGIYSWSLPLRAITCCDCVMNCFPPTVLRASVLIPIPAGMCGACCAR